LPIGFTRISQDTLNTGYAYSFPITLREAPLDVNTGASSLNWALSQRTLVLYASSAPLSAPFMSPK